MVPCMKCLLCAQAQALCCVSLHDYRHSARLPAQLWSVQRYTRCPGPVLQMEPCHPVSPNPAIVVIMSCKLNETACLFLSEDPAVNLFPSILSKEAICAQVCDSSGVSCDDDLPLPCD